MKKVIAFKQVDITEEEYSYYLRLVEQFTTPTYDGKEQFRDIFDVDEDGCISFIRPPLSKQVGWGVLFFLQNLMINQRLRRIEKKIEEKIND